MSVEFLSGLGGVAIALILRAYVSWRERHAEEALRNTHRFAELVRELQACNLPADKAEALDRMVEAVGTGYIARRLLRHLAAGSLDTPVTRERVLASRERWTGVPKAVRIKHTQAVFAALLADSFYAGVAGIIFRRAFFYARPDLGAIATGVDAYETKVLLVGADNAARHKLRDDDDCDDSALVRA